MHTITTLVVDDNESYRQGLVSYLQDLEGVEIVGEAKNGREAIDKTHILHPELVLMDISMPGLGGLEATRLIKEQHPDTKIVFVTIHEEKTYQALANMLDADGFVSKSSVKQDIPKMLNKLRSSHNGHGD